MRHLPLAHGGQGLAGTSRRRPGTGPAAWLAHQGAALLPLLRAWRSPKDGAFLTHVQRSTAEFAARYPDLMDPRGPVALQDLTKRELEVLRLMGLGKRGTEIRELLSITENTLKIHSRRLFQKLNVNSRAEAVAAARRLHLI